MPLLPGEAWRQAEAPSPGEALLSSLYVCIMSKSLQGSHAYHVQGEGDKRKTGRALLVCGPSPLHDCAGKEAASTYVSQHFCFTHFLYFLPSKQQHLLPLSSTDISNTERAGDMWDLHLEKLYFLKQKKAWHLEQDCTHTATSGMATHHTHTRSTFLGT